MPGATLPNFPASPAQLNVTPFMLARPTHSPHKANLIGDIKSQRGCSFAMNNSIIRNLVPSSLTIATSSGAYNFK